MTTLTPTKDVLPPPTERSTVLGWMKKNLFGSIGDSILTILGGAFLVWMIYTLIVWITTKAEWAVVTDNLQLFMKGQYPADADWRLWFLLFLLAVIVGLMWGIAIKRPTGAGWTLLIVPIVLAAWLFTLERSSWWRLLVIDVLAIIGYLLGKRYPSKLSRITYLLALLYMPIVILIVRGFGEDGFLFYVPTNLWGGLLLSLLLAIFAIVFSFPIGVLLALGRQSKLPAVKGLSVLYIELIRGVPLITLLFMGQLMLPLFLPAGITIDRVLRAIVAMIMFAAAYMAENVRGGLQSIPKGQYEAADAIGLSGWQKMVFIILPQALRAVIPVLVGQFIGLFKDTTLVALLGLLDLLGIARGVLANPNYIGRQLEVFTFIGLIYWVFSYGMSYGSQRLEAVLGVGER
ncbi:MAG TPA: amino acid ABC transporter permease [Anaerolineae bacterium]|nr:amino acid ABC transporter permease [Anaerolineae bacterium]